MDINPPLMDGLIKVMLNWIESIIIYHLINLVLSLRSVSEVRLKNLFNRDDDFNSGHPPI